MTRIAACVVLAGWSAALAGTVTVLPDVDGVVYDLNPPDGTPDVVATYQYEIEAGSAYSYYRDGTIARAFFEFPISASAPAEIRSAEISLRMVSFRMESYFDLFAYPADGLPSLSDWSQPGMFIGRFTPDTMLPPFRVTADVTASVRAALARGATHFGVRAEGGPETIGGYTGFASVQWPKTPGGGLTSEDDPQIRIELVPEPRAFLLTSSSIMFLTCFALIRRLRKVQRAVCATVAASATCENCVIHESAGYCQTPNGG